MCTCACAGFLALACVEARSQHSHSLLLLDLLSLNLETGWAGLPALSGCWCRPASSRLLEGAGDRAVALMLPQHSTHWTAAQPLSFLTSWKTAWLVLRILCIPLSKFTNCFRVFRFTRLCIVWHAHTIFRKGKKALKCVESEKWSYLEKKKKKLTLAHQFMTVRESRQLSVCVCVSVVCFSLKFHVFVGRNWIQRWFPRCVSAVRELLCFITLCMSPGMIPSSSFFLESKVVFTLLKEQHTYNVPGSAQTCTCRSVLDTRQRKRSPESLLVVSGGGLSPREVRLVSRNHRSP